MISFRRSAWSRLLVALFVVGSTVGAVRGAEERALRDAFAANKSLGRGMNLGNALESPTEGEWGLTLRASYFEAIARAGFDSVRIPVRWSSHAGPAPDHTIDPVYFARVDWAIDQALAQNLTVVLNIHHDEAANHEPTDLIPRAATYWRQIATRYRDRPARLRFELLNEPNGAMTDALWQASFPTLLGAIRASNPDRTVIIGPGHWNNLASLPALSLPEADRNLIVTFHYYSPFEFTHQGAEWDPKAKDWQGQTWTATPEQLAALHRDFDSAVLWGHKHNRPLYLGEFGAYNKGDLRSRQLWTAAVVQAAEARDISWCYWEFGAGFGAYDIQANQWRQPLLEALIPPTLKTDDPRTIRVLPRR